MRRRIRAASDEGFTLIEMVIALMIMAIAIVTIVSALTTMIQLTGQHRGHAVTEVAARSYSEAVQQQAQFTTTLTAAINDSVTTVPVASTALLPPAYTGSDADQRTYVIVDREVLRVTAMTATSLTVARDVNGDGAASHASGVRVVPIMRCPTVAQLTPAGGTYLIATGVQATVSSVEYWNGSNAFQDRSACLTAYKAICATVLSDTALPECGYGYFRATIDVTTPGDSRLRSVTTSTQVLLRTGSG